jgi:hypothetical protein
LNLSPAEVKAIDDRQAIFVMYGKISYNDIFKNHTLRPSADGSLPTNRTQ